MTNLFDRIKQAVTQFSSTLPGYKQPASSPELTQEEIYGYTEQEIGYVPHAEMVAAVIRAGREQRLLYIRYNGKWRHIEPYELKQGQKVNKLLTDKVDYLGKIVLGKDMRSSWKHISKVKEEIYENSLN
ncbi:hypothetical protein LCGC14_1717300 [marine sediment metagenome]|uniref:Uncharacterized protein n=1 Tax=marine sediment metagenome TaxID=412755 RepID=A0A0F9JTW0_9ZZZZ